MSPSQPTSGKRQMKRRPEPRELPAAALRSSSYERLSGQDFSFLAFENPHVHTHVGATQIFEAGPLRTADGGIDAGLYKRAIDAVLHLIPRYRQRLMWTPIEHRPVWVDDREFNIDYHIRHTALPHPGGDEELKKLTARIMSHQLDRARPLWEQWVVEGLQGDRFAVISKLHHCMVDGSSGIDVARLTLSPTPKYEIREPQPYVPRTPPSAWELLRDSLIRPLNLPFQVAAGWRQFRRETKDFRSELRIRVEAVAEVLGWVTLPRAESPLNGTLGPHRRVDWLTTPLAECKAVSTATGCSVNDVVLATVAGAVRDFFLSRRVHPGDIEFRAANPVNVRQEAERGKMGNRVSSWLVQLPIDEPDPSKRLARVHEVTQGLKSSKQALGVDMMMVMAEWQPAAMLAMGLRATSRAANMIVTNVPGPPRPLYLLGARLLEMYSMVPLLENQGMGITIVSYDGKMCWGVNADYELVPDLRNFVRMIGTAFAQLVRATTTRPAPQPDDPKELAGGEIPPVAAGKAAKRRHGRSAASRTPKGAEFDSTG